MVRHRLPRVLHRLRRAELARDHGQARHHRRAPVDAQAKFRNSATYGEDIEIESWVEDWGGKSFVMRHVARRGDTVLCEGREVRVFAVQDPEDPLRIKAIPIPEDIRAACS